MISDSLKDRELAKFREVGTGIHGGDLILAAGSAYLLQVNNLANRPLSVDWNLLMHEHC